MKIIVFLGIILIISSCAYGQYNKKNKTQPPDTNYTLNENGERIKPSEFRGGAREYMMYLNKKLKYPKDAKAKRIEGKVYVRFTVDAIGQVKPETVTVVQSLCETCDMEAIRLIKATPRWTPARNIDTRMNVESQNVYPIVFKL